MRRRAIFIAALAVTLGATMPKAYAVEGVLARMVPATVAGTVELNWDAYSGWVYFIQASETMAPGEWVYLPEAIVGTDVEEGLVIDPLTAGAPPKMFYRVFREVDLGGPGDPQDSDGDGLTNGQEFTLGTDPLNSDTDGDGLSDSWENSNGTNPVDPDSDDDGVIDGDEISYGTDPNDPDSDDDGITDGGEVDQGTDPNDSEDTPETEILLVSSAAEGIAEIRSRTITIPAGGRNHLLIVGIHSTEYPYYTGGQGYDPYAYDDRVRWDVTPSNGPSMTGQHDVNDLHGEWNQAAADGIGYLGYSPVHIADLQVIEAEDSTAVTIQIEAEATNIEDAEEPSTVIVAAPALEIRELTFAGEGKYFELWSDDGKDEDGGTTYKGAHWIDSNGDGDALDEAQGERLYPVAYQRGTKPEVSGKIRVDLPEGVKPKVQLTGPGNVAIKATSLDEVVGGNNEWELPLTESDGALDDAIKYYYAHEEGKEFVFTWELSLDEGDTWVVIGTTKHTVYVINDDPETTLRHETLFHLSCKNADGKTVENEIIQAVWGEFTDRDVRRVDNVQLTYFKTDACVSTTTESLLKTQPVNDGDGQCTAWAHFFVDLLKVHGVDKNDEVWRILPIPAEPGEGFAIKNWQFQGQGTSGNLTYPYMNLARLGGNAANDQPHVWAYAEVPDQAGIPGQGSANPFAMFGVHYLVTYGGVLYDPSYGRSYASLDGVRSRGSWSILEL